MYSIKPFHHSQLHSTFYSIALIYSVKRHDQIVNTLLHSGRDDDVILNVPKTTAWEQSLCHLSGKDETKYNSGNKG